jgi:hypothetical protein
MGNCMTFQVQHPDDKGSPISCKVSGIQHKTYKGARVYKITVLMVSCIYWELLPSVFNDVVGYMWKLYQNGILNMDIKIYNNLPSFIKETYTTPQIFTSLLKIFLYSNSFYSLDEYFNYNLS